MLASVYVWVVERRSTQMTDQNTFRSQPWWLVDGDTKRSRRFNSYEEAVAAGIRAYQRHIAKGFYAEDKYSVVSGGDRYTISNSTTR
jgi:hypothetical protein